MNKKLLFSVLGASALVGFTACQNDDLMSNGADGGVQTVTFSAQLPSAMTRTYGEAGSIKKLQYAIYASGTDNKVKEGTEDVVEKSATVSVDLVKGQSYDVYFWADKGTGSPYTFNGKTVSINYDSKGNDDARDAFYASKTIKASSTEEAITLTRPFAQLNIGTNDYVGKADQYFSIEYVEIKTKAYNAIDLATGTAAGSENNYVDVTFKAELPTDETFPISGYTYLAMDYLFVGESVSETVEMIVKSTNGKTVTNNYQSVPMKKNYRTNIAGALLTSQSEWTVSIDKNFNADIDPFTWDGESVEMPTENENGSYSINNAAQLAGFANLVNTGSIDGKAKTATKDYTKADFTLNFDINLNGNSWTPIGSETKPYKGKFNGGYHTISNFKIEGTENVGFFGKVSDNGEVKNVTFKNVEITGEKRIGTAIGNLGIPYDSKHNVSDIKVEDVTINGNHWVGGIVGYAYGNVENCEANNITITATPKLKADGTYENGDKVGGLVGQALEYPYSISGKVTNATIKGFRDLGGIVGSISGGEIVGHVSNITIIVDNSFHCTDEKGEDEQAGNAEEIAGRKVNPTTISENSTVENVTICFAKVDDMTIYNASQLKIFGSTVNAGNSYRDKTITLGDNIDLSSIEDWMPIGIICEDKTVRAFEGTFNGNDKTISKMKISQNVGHLEELKTNNKAYARAFFGVVKNATIKNVTFDHATIDCGLDKGNIQGIVAGYARGNSTFEKVKVKDSSNRGFGKLGAIAGYSDENEERGTLIFNGCVVENTTISGAYNMGGLIGTIENQITVEEYSSCNVKGVIFNCIKPAEELFVINGYTYWIFDNEYYGVKSTYYCTHDVKQVDYNGGKVTIDGTCN
jgi:hypothetical protein